MHQRRFRGPAGRLCIVAMFILPAAAMFISGCASDDRADSPHTRVLPVVEAVRARQGTLPLIQRLSGLVKARNQVEIYPEISAIITEVLVSNGDEVRRGQPLLRLRSAEFEQRLTQAGANHRITEAQLRSAQARLKEARAELERMRSLARQGLASMAELETAEAQAESAAAEVELAQARIEQALAGIEEQKDNLARTVIRSPIDGHVGNRNAEPGMLAGPGTRLFILGQLDSVRVEVVLTDRMLTSIEQGQRAEIQVGGAVMSAPLSRISPFLHPLTHSTEAEIDLANPENLLKPGMFVTVDIYYGESEEATLVPLSAIHENIATGLVGVYIAAEGVDGAQIQESGGGQPEIMTDPILFEFVPIQIIAEGRMEAAVRPVASGSWVVIVGQNLLGSEASDARMRPVDWNRVTRLQNLQREDLMREMVQRKAESRETD